MFTVRIRAYAAAHFEYSKFIKLTWTDAEATLQSEYTGGADGRAYAVTLHGEVHGPASSIEDAQRRLMPVVAEALPVIALSANSAVADLLVVAAYGIDLTEPQPYLGYRTPQGWDWFPPGKRRIDAEATLALIRALVMNPTARLLRQGIESYRRALGHWTPETRLLAGEFLYIAAETLSRHLLEARAAAKHMTPKNLARMDRVSEKILRGRILEQDVLAGDKEALQALRDASDGFEHGYMAADEVRGLLQPVLERSMGHVRRALIKAVGIDAASEARLFDHTYDEPRGLVSDMWVVSGQLSRKEEAGPTPPMDSVRVELAWNDAKPVAVQTASGDVEISFPWEVTVGYIAPDVRLGVSGIGVRAAYVRQTSSAPLDVTVNRRAEP